MGSYDKQDLSSGTTGIGRIRVPKALPGENVQAEASPAAEEKVGPIPNDEARVSPEALAHAETPLAVLVARAKAAPLAAPRERPAPPLTAAQEMLRHATEVYGEKKSVFRVADTRDALEKALAVSGSVEDALAVGMMAARIGGELKEDRHWYREFKAVRNQAFERAAELCSDVPEALRLAQAIHDGVDPMMAGEGKKAALQRALALSSTAEDAAKTAQMAGAGKLGTRFDSLHEEHGAGYLLAAKLCTTRTEALQVAAHRDNHRATAAYERALELGGTKEEAQQVLDLAARNPQVDADQFKALQRAVQETSRSRRSTGYGTIIREKIWNILP